MTKMKKMPTTDDISVIYLDSYDELRRMRQCAEVLHGQASARRLRFRELCREKGLPLNDGCIRLRISDSNVEPFDFRHWRPIE